MISCFVPEIFKVSYYANLVTDDVIGCASTVVWHEIKNISANIEAMLLKLSRDVASYKIYQMVHILMLLWQHSRLQSPASSKSNTINCSCTWHQMQLKMLKRRCHSDLGIPVFWVPPYQMCLAVQFHFFCSGVERMPCGFWSALSDLWRGYVRVWWCFRCESLTVAW